MVFIYCILDINNINQLRVYDFKHGIRAKNLAAILSLPLFFTTHHTTSQKPRWLLQRASPSSAAAAESLKGISRPCRCCLRPPEGLALDTWTSCISVQSRRSPLLTCPEPSRPPEPFSNIVVDFYSGPASLRSFESPGGIPELHMVRSGQNWSDLVYSLLKIIFFMLI